jgi:hypothetical protein
MDIAAQQATQLATVMMIGENGEEAEKLNLSHKQLLDMCHQDMYQAYDKWLNFLADIEAFASATNTDLKGIKMWLQVYWRKDGSISHIMFFPKPGSKEVESDNLKFFFQQFVVGYKMQIAATTAYTHYGSAAFPMQTRHLQVSKK